MKCSEKRWILREPRLTALFFEIKEPSRQVFIRHELRKIVKRAFSRSTSFSSDTSIKKRVVSIRIFSKYLNSFLFLSFCSGPEGRKNFFSELFHPEEIYFVEVFIFFLFGASKESELWWKRNSKFMDFLKIHWIFSANILSLSSPKSFFIQRI